MQQLALLPEIAPLRKDVVHAAFSHDSVCADVERRSLETRYADLFEETDRFSRRLVSFQANKTETLHSWMTYREGFSAELVELLLLEMGLAPGDCLLDPFAGSCTTLLAAKMMGIDAVGIELLPHCHLAWEAKSRAFTYDLAEVHHLRQLIATETPPAAGAAFPHLTITDSAFPEQTEREIMNYTRWFAEMNLSDDAKILARLLILSILERVSYTRKDGQYLRWDQRAARFHKRDGHGASPSAIHKGTLPSVKEALLEALHKIILDIARLQADPPGPSKQSLIAGNALFTLPELPDDHFAGVITSPPYANRYDYTRTYALELAYLGVDADIFDLRQNLLSCTVENKSKISAIFGYYEKSGNLERFHRILLSVQSNPVLSEINTALKTRSQRAEINNRGVISMIDGYFTELSFIFAELHRVCQHNAIVAVVNDNVRYAGEIIPVDTLSTYIAERLGFIPIKIYVLPQRKGNSSQQMGRFGRQALRKSITLWRKV